MSQRFEDRLAARRGLLARHRADGARQRGGRALAAAVDQQGGDTTGFSLAYSLATAIFGGFTPVVSTWLIQALDNKRSPWRANRRARSRWCGRWPARSRSAPPPSRRYSCRLYGSYNGAMVVALTEIVPANVRTTGFSLAYSLATTISVSATTIAPL
jgi:hypothetical protein